MYPYKGCKQILHIVYRYTKRDQSMANAILVHRALPAAAADAVRSLGQDIATARKRRRISVRLMAQRMMVSPVTVQRLEKGDPSVGLGIVASALWVFGMTQRLRDLVNPASDAIGQSEEIGRLPQRVRSSSADEFDF